MQSMLVLAFLLSPVPTAEEVDPKIKRYLEFMTLSFACGGSESAEYRAAKGAARRALMQYSPSTTYTVRDITNLDRGLRDSSITPSASIDLADCENLLIEGRADLQ